MSSWSLQVLRVRRYLCATALIAALSYGAEPAVTSVAPHALVTATEALYQHNLPQACDEVMKLTAMAPGLTDDDLIRLQLLTAARALDDSNELAARRALSQALQVDRTIEPPPYASKLAKMLEEARKQFPAGTSKDKDAQLAAARKAASAREPSPRALLRVVDALYVNLQIEGAVVVLDLARASAPMPAQEMAQLLLRQGILQMEMGDEESARAAFREALKVDRGASLPGYAPPKTLRVFEEIWHPATPVATVPAPPVVTTVEPKQVVQKPTVPKATSTTTRGAGNTLFDGSRSWGIVAGGAGFALIAGGAVAGVIALSSLDAEKRASRDGDYAAYTQARDAAITARSVANGLYGVGAVALGAGAYLFLRAPGGTSVGAIAGDGQATVVVGGHF